VWASGEQILVEVLSTKTDAAVSARCHGRGFPSRVIAEIAVHFAASEAFGDAQDRSG
jgi:hypothetical protein